MKKAKVILLSGQSNAVGVGHVKYLPEHYEEETVKRFKEGYKNVLIRYTSHNIKNEKFEAVRVNQTERTRDTLGPEVGIAKKLTEKYPGEQFFIIKCAFGGSDMHVGWRSPSSGVPYDPEMAVEPAKAISDSAYRPLGWCYHEQIGVLDSALSELEAMGYQPEIVAFCWMQGESDSGNPERADNYIFRFDAMLHDLRERYSQYFKNCTYIDAGISEMWASFETMNARKRAYAEKCGHHFIDTIAAGLTTKNEPYENPDTAHYDVSSVVKLGELFAEYI